MGIKISLMILSFVFVFLFLINTSLVSAAVYTYNESLFYSGYLTFDLKDSYSVGEKLETQITVQNRESFPIVNSYLVVYLVEGCAEPTYPTQFSDCDTIFYEKKIEPINLNIGEKKTISFSYTLPANLKSGTYRMDAYWKTKITPIIGMVESFFQPEYKSFKVSGVGNFPSVKILPSKTQVGGGYSQSGPGAYPNVSISGTIYVKNSVSEKFEGNLFVSICSFDDTACDSFIIEKQYSVSLEGNEEKGIKIEFESPSKPDAYAIKLELKDKDGKLVSLYKSRIVTLGETVKIKKLSVNDVDFDVGAKGWISTLITGSMFPTQATVSNAKLTVSLTDLNTDKEVYKESVVVPEVKTDDRIANKFTFSTTEILNKFKVCAETSAQGGEIYDKYCYNVNFQDFPVGEHQFTVDKSYNSKTKELSLNLCALDEYKELTSANVEIEFFVPEPFTLIKEQNLSIVGCEELKLTVEEGIYKLVVRDLDLKEHFEFPLNVTKEEIEVPSVVGYGNIILISIILIIIIIVVILYRRGRA